MLLALVALCSACGFHLRNALVLPAELNPVRVVAPDPYSPLAESLADAMTRAGAQPATDPAQPSTTLQVLSERWGDTPISIDEKGRAQEFSLRYAVIFTLVDPAGNVVVPQQAVELSRDYVAPPTDAVGATSERELLAKELRREMSTAILRRVGAALNVTHPEDRGNAPAPAAAAPAPQS
ncbi:Rare lipoprotein b family protein [Lysobacter dokdonensis DS-58]|uniref:LPS-assembly lipoprotein LptE n=1 Tax=Lysobacter dokdonensis DS-58 TaxID=1300345 RepID=A0A0A2WR09_9GAMM|nr:Rare lipoprotein b family protein [Lysobacter dokdonensis DS-58]